jgi:hypothetical protein
MDLKRAGNLEEEKEVYKKGRNTVLTKIRIDHN